MTPTDVITAARDIYNATGDTYFADTQMYNWIWQACQELATEAWLIEGLDTTQSTVAGTQAYAYPTNAIAIKRVAVNGSKLKPITMRMDDAITLSNATVTTTGRPIYYTDWNSTIYMRPTPDSVYSISYYYYKTASTINASSTLEVPTLFHFNLVDYCLWRMFSKDKDLENIGFHQMQWEKHVLKAKSYQKRKKRTDSFATVQSEDVLPVTILGEA